jgi:hypothetical protein
MSMIVAIQCIATLAIFANTLAEPLMREKCGGQLVGSESFIEVLQKWFDITFLSPFAERSDTKAGFCGYKNIVFGVCGMYLNFLCLRLAIVLRNGFVSSEAALAMWVNVSVEEETFASPERCEWCPDTSCCGSSQEGAPASWPNAWNRTTNSVEEGWLPENECLQSIDVACDDNPSCKLKDIGTIVCGVFCCNGMWGICCLTLQRECYACEGTNFVKKRIRGGAREYVASSRSEFEDAQNPDSIWSQAKAARARSRAGAQRSAVPVTMVCNPMAGRSISSASTASRDIRTRSLSMHGDSSGEGGDNAAAWPQPECKSVIGDERGAEEKRAREEAEAAARRGK